MQSLTRPIFNARFFVDLRCLAACLLVSLFLAAPRNAAAADRDLATLLPADTLVAAEWSHLGGGPNDWLAALASAAKSPFGKELFGHEQSSIARLLGVLRDGAHGPGAAAITLDGDKPQFLIAVDTGETPIKLEELLPKETQTETIKGVDFTQTRAEGDIDTYIAVHQKLLLISSSPAGAATLVDGAAGKLTANLTTNAEFKYCREKTRSASEWRLTIWANLGPAVKLLQEMGLPHDALEPLGLSDAKSAFIHMDDTKDGSRFLMHVHMPGKGLLRDIYTQAPVADADLAIVPKDAYYAYTWNFDLHDFSEKVLDAADAIDPEARQNAEGVLAVAARMMGFSLNDLTGCLGDTWTVYDSPQHGGVMFLGMVLAVEVKDAEGLRGIVARVEQLVQAGMGEDSRIQHRQLHDGSHTVEYILIEGLPIPIALSWGFVEGHLVLALQPQTAALAMRQADAKTRKESLLDHADFKARRGLVGKEVTGLWYCDSRYYYQNIHGVVQAVQTVLASLTAGQPDAFDLERVPLFPDAMAGVHCGVAGYSTDADGLNYVAYDNNPLMLVMTSGSAVAAISSVSILLPSLTRARELAKRAVSSANLRGIGMACHIYANDHQDAFPPDLQSLIDGGMLTQKQLQSPRDSDASDTNPSYIYLAGQSVTGDMRNILAYEKFIGEEGTNVLFLDGHVEFIRGRETFEKMLTETKTRIESADTKGKGNKRK